MTTVSPKPLLEARSTVADQAMQWFNRLPLPSYSVASEMSELYIAGSNGRLLGSRSGQTKRKLEFDLGRRCAAVALASFDNFDPVAVNEDRSPHWPVGFAGSISHNDHYAWAVATKQVHVQSIGIDVETVMSPSTHNEIHQEIVSESEWSLVRASNNSLSDEQLFTVLFSAKESFYKCWHPLRGCFFLEFLDVQVVSANEHSVTLETNELPSTTAEKSKLLVYFKVIEDQTFTVTWIEGGA